MKGIDIFFIDGTDISIDSFHENDLKIIHGELVVYTTYIYRYDISTILKYDVYEICRCGRKIVGSTCSLLHDIYDIYDIYYDEEVYVEFIQQMENVRILYDMSYYDYIYTVTNSKEQILYDNIGIKLRDYIISDKLLENPNYILPSDIKKMFDHYYIPYRYYIFENPKFEYYRKNYERKLKLDFIKNL